MGVTPHDYLIRQRVGRAKQLLAGTDMPLSEIALAAGFAHQSHFARRFRQHVGMSPRHYRWLSPWRWDPAIAVASTCCRTGKRILNKAPRWSPRRSHRESNREALPSRSGFPPSRRSGDRLRRAAPFWSASAVHLRLVGARTTRLFGRAPACRFLRQLCRASIARPTTLSGQKSPNCRMGLQAMGTMLSLSFSSNTGGAYTPTGRTFRCSRALRSRGPHWGQRH